MQENCTTARREVLSILGLSAVGTLAGCTGTDNGDDDDEPDVDQGDDDPDTDDGDDAEGPSFTVAVDDIPDVEPSENVDVEVTVENTGEEHDTQPLDVMVNDDLQESKSIELDSGAETQLDVMITAPGNSGDHDVRVTTDDDEETTTLTVTDPSGSNKPINLSGTGSETREDIEINGEEPVMIEGFHDDDGDFSVTFKHPEDGPQPIIFALDGDAVEREYEGQQARIIGMDTFDVDVEASGDWEVTIRELEVDDRETVSLPIDESGVGEMLIGPVDFDGESVLYWENNGPGMVVELVPLPDVDREPVLQSSSEEGRTPFTFDGRALINVSTPRDWSIEIESE